MPELKFKLEFKVTKKRASGSEEIFPGKRLKTVDCQAAHADVRGEMVLTNPVILARIFSSLPPPDLKTAALVSRTWRAVLEIPMFWTWATFRLGRHSFTERRRSRRLRQVGGVLGELDLTAGQLKSLLLLVADCRLRKLNNSD